MFVQVNDNGAQMDGRILDFLGTAYVISMIKSLNTIIQQLPVIVIHGDEPFRYPKKGKALFNMLKCLILWNLFPMMVEIRPG